MRHITSVISLVVIIGFSFYLLTGIFDSNWDHLQNKDEVAQAEEEVLKPIEPYRTFLTIQSYIMENNGELDNPISHVRVEIVSPDGENMIKLPHGGKYWAIGNGQTQEISETYEIPWGFIEKDGFNVSIQMVRRGAWFKPCNFKISELSQFNRKYICRTNLKWLENKGLPEAQWNKEGIQIRVFTDKNSLAKEIPNNAVALKW